MERIFIIFDIKTQLYFYDYVSCCKRFTKDISEAMQFYNEESALKYFFNLYEWDDTDNGFFEVKAIYINSNK